MKWADPPALAVVSGKQSYLVRREVDRALVANRGRRVSKIAGDDYGAILDAIETPSMFDIQDVLIVVEKPEKLPSTDVLIEHSQAGENDTAVILAFEGDPPAKAGFKKLLEELPEKHHLKFPLPKPWEIGKAALEFCQEEARSLGLRLEAKAASPLITVVGTDYGVLAYEIRKAAALARGEGRKEIRRQDLGKTVAPVFQHEAFPIVDALGARDGKRVLRNLGMVERTSRDDPTMKVCGLLGNRVSLWIRATYLMGTGYYDANEAAQRLGMHHFPFKKDLLPITKKWSVAALVDLLKGIASVERGVKSGRANPWVQLNALLYGACQG